MDRRNLALAVTEVQGMKGRCEGEGVYLVEQREEQSSLGREGDDKVYSTWMRRVMEAKVKKKQQKRL